MAGTTVYPAKVALKALLQAWSWPVSAPDVKWGSPTEGEDHSSLDAIYFGPVDITDDFQAFGARSDESYALPVVIDVRRYGDDEQATEARAWVLHDNVITLLRANTTLSGAVQRITGFRVRQVNPVPSPQQWRSQIVIDVRCVGLIFY